MPETEHVAAGARALEQQLAGVLSDAAELGDELSVNNDSLWRRLDLLPIPLLLTRDASARDMRANLAGQRLFRADRARNLSQSAPEDERPPFQVFADDRLVPADELPMQKAAATGRPVEQSECELRFEDGSSVFILGHCVPVFDQAGQVRASLGAFLDITERKRLEQENRLLAQELGHRARNNIAIIQGVASLTLRPYLSREVYQAFSDRLGSLGRAGDMLSRSHWRSAPVDAVIRDALLPYVGADSHRARMSGPDVMLAAQIATSLSLAMNELATNAVKYGALSSPEGLVSIEWRPSENRPKQIEIAWEERGGPPVVPPTRNGFGSRFLRSLHGFGAQPEIRFEPDGVRCRLWVPTKG